MSSLFSFAINDETGDLVFDEKLRLAMVDGNDARKQRLWLRLGTKTSEWFLDNRFGVPWLDLVEKGTDDRLIEVEVRKALLDDDEVVGVERLSLKRLPNRVLHVDFEVMCVDGERIAGEVTI